MQRLFMLLLPFIAIGLYYGYLAPQSTRDDFRKWMNTHVWSSPAPEAAQWKIRLEVEGPSGSKVGGMLKVEVPQTAKIVDSQFEITLPGKWETTAGPSGYDLKFHDFVASTMKYKLFIDDVQVGPGGLYNATLDNQGVTFVLKEKSMEKRGTKTPAPKKK